MFEKIEGTEDVYAKRIKVSWVKALISGELKDEEMFSAMEELALKVICDKDGKSLEQDDLYLDDLGAIQEYIMSKLPGKKKAKRA